MVRYSDSILVDSDSSWSPAPLGCVAGEGHGGANCLRGAIGDAFMFVVGDCALPKLSLQHLRSAVLV